ncbi:MAG TPA: hypothetical protein PLX45_22245, partial [Piscinibacter sp.]|nr:hypothetical protein [Piscinibacter sp.]
MRAVVPACLIERPQWVCWKYEQRDGKATKVPINPRTGQKASSTDPSTWTSFDDAVAACRRFTTLEGVGFVFTQDDPFWVKTKPTPSSVVKRRQAATASSPRTTRSAASTWMTAE